MEEYDLTSVGSNGSSFNSRKKTPQTSNKPQKSWRFFIRLLLILLTAVILIAVTVVFVLSLGLPKSTQISGPIDLQEETVPNICGNETTTGCSEKMKNNQKWFQERLQTLKSEMMNSLEQNLNLLMEAKISNLKSQMVSENAELKGRLALNDAQMIIKNNEINTLKSQMTIKDNEIVELKSKMSIKDNEIVELKSKVTINENKIIELISKMTIKDNEIVELKSKMTINENQIAELKSKLTIRNSDEGEKMRSKQNETFDIVTNLSVTNGEVTELKFTVSQLLTNFSVLNDGVNVLQLLANRVNRTNRLVYIEGNLTRLISEFEAIRVKANDQSEVSRQMALQFNKVESEIPKIADNLTIFQAKLSQASSRLDILESMASRLTNTSTTIDLSGPDFFSELKSLRESSNKNLESLIVRLEKVESECAATATALNSMSTSSETETETQNDLELKEIKSDIKRLKFIANLSNKTPRSCQEYMDFGVNENGIYQIDPDGSGSGSPPITVFCNFEDGSTVIGHDHLDAFPIPEPCSSQNCFNLTLDYEISIEQIKNLIRISKTCRQYIRFDCKLAALERVAFWKSSDGQMQNYFDGNDPSQHTCKCAKEVKSCERPPWDKKCNCDIPHSTNWTFDDGYFTKKEHLPVMGFMYGYLRGSANITIGKLECFGEIDVEPDSCNSLKMQGLLHSGYYINGQPNETDGNLNIVYCNMSLPFFDKQMETRMGSIQLKPFRFLLEQNQVATWNQNETINFTNQILNSTVSVVNDTYILIPKSSTYIFILSGTVEKPNAEITFVVKSTILTTPEPISEEGSKNYYLTETTQRSYLNGGYGGGYSDIFKYRLDKINTLYKRGINRLIVKNLRAGDKVSLMVTSTEGIKTGPTKPLRFMGFEWI